MKKRLSDSNVLKFTTPLLIIALFISISGGMRVLTLWFDYGVVLANIPVVQIPKEDIRTQHDLGTLRKSLSERTLLVALKSNGDIVFGDHQSFLRKNSRHRFLIPSDRGAPQIGTLLENAKEWSNHRLKAIGTPWDGIIVLAPSASVPVTTVTEVLALFNQSEFVDNTILASGIRL